METLITIGSIIILLLIILIVLVLSLLSIDKQVNDSYDAAYIADNFVDETTSMGFNKTIHTYHIGSWNLQKEQFKYVKIRSHDMKFFEAFIFNDVGLMYKLNRKHITYLDDTTMRLEVPSSILNIIENFTDKNKNRGIIRIVT